MGTKKIDDTMIGKVIRMSDRQRMVTIPLAIKDIEVGDYVTIKKVNMEEI